MIEIAHDARIREAVQLSFGRVLHPDEVAADKTLALFGRAAARDLVDVAALLVPYTLEQLCELAAEKDAGFDRRVFERLSRRRSSLRRRLRRTRLGAGNCGRPTGERGSMARPTAGCRGHVRRGHCAVLRPAYAAGVGGLGSTSSPRPSERHRSPSDAGRDGPSRSR
jgi:hypothetical protein